MALSTTEEEITDLLYLAIQKFFKKTGYYPFICWDNNRIQANVDVTNIESNYNKGTPLRLPRNYKIPLPTHSPDCNQPVEHCFANGKRHIKDSIYSSAVHITTGRELQRVVRKQFTEDMPEGAVVADVQHLVTVWEIISTPAGVEFQASDNKTHVGTGGNWPLAGDR